MEQMDRAAIAQRQEAVLEADADILRHFGMTFVSAAEGRAEMRLSVRPELVNAAGFAHGGLLFTLADTCAAYAVGSGGQRGATVASSFSFLRAARGGMEVRGTAWTVHRGRRLATVQTEVRDGSADDMLLATGTLTFALLEEA